MSPQSRKSVKQQKLEERRMLADTIKAESEAQESKIKLRRVQWEEKKMQASSEFNCIYHFVGGVEEDKVVKCIDTMDAWSRSQPGHDMTLILNSPGGSIIDGLALFDFILELRKRGHKVIIIVRGYACSMASIILQSADERIVGKNAYVMIHEAATEAGGKVSVLENRIDFTKALQARTMKILADRSKLSVREIEEKSLHTDWWIDARAAVRLGFADRIG